MVHQFVVRASRGELSTQVALALQPSLRRIGPSEVYAAHVDEDLREAVRPLAAYRGDPATEGAVPILFHVSVGDPDMLAFMLERNGPIVLVHQSVPRPEPLVDFDPARAQALAYGQAQLGLLRDRVVFALADTSLTAAALRAQGYDDVRVSPLPPDLTALHEIPDHPPTKHHFDEMVEGPLLLFVGRVDPGERIELLVEAYHSLVTYLTPKVHLALVGTQPAAGYAGALEDFMWKLGLLRAWLEVEPERTKLATYLRRATLFVTASEDPGLSFPALEALSFGVPVIARAAGGLRETVAGGGLLVPPDGGPLLFAETIATVLGDEAYRSALVSRAESRAADFDRAASEASLLTQLLLATTSEPSG